MSGSQQRADPKLCWNCGKRGVPGVGSRMTRPEASDMDAVVVSCSR